MIKAALTLSALALALAPDLTANVRVAHFEAMADAGDVQAMMSLGLIHHFGEGVEVSHEKAMHWYIRAYDRFDGDAFNNIGVLFRDGLGVPRNRKIAYLLFLIVHMEGLGTEGTQYRAGRNLSHLARDLKPEQIREALSYTRNYVDQVVRSHGANLETGPDVLPSAERIPFKDYHWWTDAEREQLRFDPPHPWNKRTLTADHDPAPKPR